jgi:hypothetical protein
LEDQRAFLLELTKNSRRGVRVDTTRQHKAFLKGGLMKFREDVYVLPRLELFWNAAYALGLENVPPWRGEPKSGARALEMIDALARCCKAKQPTASDPTARRPDGPEAPHWLWFKNKRRRIGAKRAKRSWELLNYFWERDSATYEELQGPGKPWVDPVNDSTISTATGRFNNEMPPGFPWKLTTKNRCVTKESRQNPPM